MSHSAFEACLEFVLELENLKKVERKTRPIGQDRYENSAEHSWQVALLALTLRDYANEAVDISRVVRMLLLHDIAEIDTGDTIVYARPDAKGPNDEERAAFERLTGSLPPGVRAEYRELCEEFAAGATAEARYANAMDRAMPVLQNVTNGGRSWQEHGIRKSQVIAKNAGVGAGSETLWAWLEERVHGVYPQGEDEL